MLNLDFLANKNVAVMGLGKSGLATARALVASGAQVRVWDDGEKARASAIAEGFPVSDLAAADMGGFDAIIWSPGIPHTHPKPHPVAVKARAAGLTLVCDVDLLGRADPDATYVGITGTNGKSTTTALIGHILTGAGRRISVGGNIGVAVTTLDALGAGGVHVLEMSSYQTELTQSVHFHVAALINITPDHLARHGGIDGYAAAKEMMFAGQTAGDHAVIGVDDPHCRAIADRLAARGVTVHRVENGMLAGAPDLSGFSALRGAHNRQNAAIAFAVCRALGVDQQVILAAMADFPGLAHRQQKVGALANVEFINDSKATNAEAAAMALATFDPIYWIIGGQAKETGLDGLEGLMGRVRHAFVIGEAEARFCDWLTTHGVAHTRCGTLDRATRAAADLALADGLDGAAVLLSPACASWDQFTSFEARGDAFAALATAIIDERTGSGGSAP